MQIDLSVIIPVYNTDIKKLDRCFESVRELQCLCNEEDMTAEGIIVDDGSVDDVAEWCKQFAFNNDGFKYIRKGNGGVSSARNYGIKSSNGNYICFVDSDDELELEGFPLRMLVETDYDIIFSDPIIMRESSEECWKAFDLQQGDISSYDVLQKMTSDGKLNGPWCKLIKRKFLLSHDISFDNNMISGEDAVFLMDMVSFSPKMYYKDIVTYRYFIEAATSINRMMKDVKLFVENNKKMYLKMIELIQNTVDERSKNHLVCKATQRYMKQLLNIAADLITFHAFNKYNKKIISEAVDVADQYEAIAEKKQFSFRSRMQYDLIRKKRWKCICLYSSARRLYLRVKKLRNTG